MAYLFALACPSVVRPGESFQVTVLDDTGAPLIPPLDVIVDINGQCGVSQFLQYSVRGKYTLQASARLLDGTLLETLSTEVKVDGGAMLFDAGDGVAIPMLTISNEPEVPYKFTAQLGMQVPEGHTDWVPAQPVSSDRRYLWSVGPMVDPEITEEPWFAFDALWSMDHSLPHSQLDIRCQVLPEGIDVTRTLTLISAPRLLLDKEFVVPIVRNNRMVEVGEGLYTCNLYVHNVGSDPIELAARSITTMLSDENAIAVEQFVWFDTPLRIEAATTAGVVVPVRVGHDIPKVAEGVLINFAAKSDAGLPGRVEAAFDVPLRPGPFKHDLDIPEPRDWPWDEIIDGLWGIDERFAPFQSDPVTGVIVGKIPGGSDASGRAPDVADAISRLIQTIFERQLLGVHMPASALTVANAHRNNHEGTLLSNDLCLDAMLTVGPVAEGETCDPDNISDADMAAAAAGQFACVLSDKTICVNRPARWVNAHKGDIVISPSDQWSLVADVLASVTPAQPFSHSGIMTRNFDEITHSTASEDWLLDHKSDSFTSDGSDGLKPEALRYLWPGVVAQSVRASIEGEPWIAPDNGKTYQISSFSLASATANGFQYVPAMVIMPDPVLEAAQPEVRTKLRAVANGIRAYSGSSGTDGSPPQNSKSHYRFFCFSDARFSETSITPGGHGWADGTFPSVCSVLIWREMRKQNLTMEGPNPVVVLSDLEQSDLMAGAKIAPGTLDGLYHYTAADRQKAGQILFDKIDKMVYEQAGWLGEALTDASDDTGNQIVNTFDSDDVNGKDSEDWRSTGASDGVSPANLLWWDGPDRDGSYGFAAPAGYRAAVTEPFRLSTWRHYETKGSVSGTVKRPDGSPVASAFVQVFDGAMSGTQANGFYQIDDIPYLPEGSEYTLTAAVVVDRDLYTASKTIKVQAPTQTVDLVLDAPPTSHRKVQIDASVVGGDDEDWPESDESYSHTDAPMFIEISKDDPFKVIGTGRDPKYRWGGEVRVEHNVEVALLTGASIQVSAKGWLYEGTSESTNDLDGEGSLTRVVVGPEETRELKLRMSNTDEDEPDTFSELKLVITNRAFP
jgi:hypothetical protein